MATVQKIYEEMQRMAPLELAESWDNPGLLVDCGGEVSRLLVALDVTAETLAEAEQNGCQLAEKTEPGGSAVPAGAERHLRHLYAHQPGCRRGRRQ